MYLEAMMINQWSNFPKISPRLLVASLFLFLAISLEMLVSVYWFYVLNPRLLTEAESNAKILAESQARIISSVLTQKSQEIEQNDIDELIDQVLIFIDPELKRPYFIGLSFEFDEEIVKLETNSLTLSKGNMNCQSCFPVTTPLFSNDSHELIGLVNFMVSDVFYIKLKDDIKQVLFLESLIALVVLFFVWLTINILIQRLNNEVLLRKKMTQELSIAKEKAEKANKIKSNFLANMSHEIRTPLNAISGMTYILLKTPLNEKQSDLLAKLQSSSQLLLQLINDLLDFSKIEAGKLELENIQFSLNEVFTKLSAVVDDIALEKGLKISYQSSDDTPKQLMGDPLRLGQILLNLINNAIKFTSSGHILISTQLINNQSHDDTCMLKFSVEDTGIGITKNQQKNLFKSFHQADNSITRKFGGTGLGLSICKQLIELMDGSISIKSVYGQGSTFSFTAQFKQYSSTAPLIYLPMEEFLPQKGQQKHILLTEDNVINQEVICALLQEMKLKFTIANNGLEALKALEIASFDLILMDLQMPEMDGFEATKQIRLIERYKKVPIIAMTAHAMEGYRQQCLDAQMDDYITKPVEVHNFFTVIQKWLRTEIIYDLKQPIKKEQTQVTHSYPKLAHINTKSLLLRVRDNHELLLHLLNKFKKQKSDIIKNLTSAIAQENWVLVKELVHNLKGESGTLEATELYKASIAMEQFLFKNEFTAENIKPYLKDLEDTFILLIKDIDQLEQSSISLSNNTPDPINNNYLNSQPKFTISSQTTIQLQELTQLLSDNNLRAKTLAKKLDKEMSLSVHANQWEYFMLALSDLDFELALNTLLKIGLSR